jgi:hypothetical protein
MIFAMKTLVGLQLDFFSISAREEVGQPWVKSVTIRQYLGVE